MDIVVSIATAVSAWIILWEERKQNKLFVTIVLSCVTLSACLVIVTTTITM